MGPAQRSTTEPKQVQRPAPLDFQLPGSGPRPSITLPFPSAFSSLVSLGSRLVKPSSSPLVIARYSLSSGTVALVFQ